MTDRPEELDAAQLDQVSGGIGHTMGHGGSVSQGTDLAMIQLQSLVSQRQTAVQETTNLLTTMDDTTKSVLKNLGS